MAMVEEQIFVDELKAKYLETKLRVKRLEEEKEYAIGCIVRKGPQKQYCYWQRNENGKQVQRYLPPNQVESVEKRILAAKENRQKLMDLKHFLSTLKKLLRSIGIQGEEIVADYEKRQVAKEKEDIHLRMAQEIASTKRYAENYRHLTDRGEYVASKSELIIACKQSSKIYQNSPESIPLLRLQNGTIRHKVYQSNSVSN